MAKGCSRSPLGGMVGQAVAAPLRAWPVVLIETGWTPEYPDLQPRSYPVYRDRVFDAALQAVGLLARWTVAPARLERARFRAEATTLVCHCGDDVTIRLEERNGATVVLVRSVSRVERADLGQNARNVWAFLAELDREMAVGPSRG